LSYLLVMRFLLVICWCNKNWWSVMQLGRESARGNCIEWSVLRLTSRCTHSFYIFKYEQVVI